MAFIVPLLPYIAVGAQGLSTISGLATGFSNAKTARQQGDIAMQQAELNAQQTRKQGDRATSTQFAAAGASGVVPTEGSPIDVILEQERETALRRADELYAGKIGKYNANQRAQQYEMDAWGNFIGGIGKTAASAYGLFGQSLKRVNQNSVQGGSVTP